MDLASNQVCGYLDQWTEGTYTAEGIKAIADALHVNASLTKLDVRYNYIMRGEEGKAALQKAVDGRSGFALIL